MIFYAAAILFVANFALGVLVQFGIVDTKPFCWLHHALFFAPAALTSLAMILYATGCVSCFRRLISGFPGSP